MKESMKLFKQWGEMFTDTIFDMVVTGKASFKSLFTSIATEILKAGIRKFITAPLFSAIGLPIPGFQAGGAVTGGNPIMVGERGPELFLPNTGGRIVPNGQINEVREDIGGVSIIQHMNFAEGVNEAARAEIYGSLPMIRKAAVEAVVDYQRRRGKEI